jgi:hypothetical protein
MSVPTAPSGMMDRIQAHSVELPHFAYGLHQAGIQARALGLHGFTAIEFGVAGGKSLLVLEDQAAQIESELGIRIAVLGYDTGEGMPEAEDYRDLPYIWQKGFFRMDYAALGQRLRRARLVIGDIRETILQRDIEETGLPVGFISIDVDYYSSTKAAFRLFDKASETRLPRAFCYMDDVVGDHWELHCDYVGELLAIREFNEEHPHQKIARVHGLRAKLPHPSWWADWLFVHHDFQHPLYNRHIHPRKNWQLPLP